MSGERPDYSDIINTLRGNQTPGGLGGGLPPARGGATSSGGGSDMEVRIAKLEAHMEHVREDLGKLADVPVKLGVLETKVDALPGKGFVVTAATGGVALLTALLILLQHLGVLH